MTGESSRNPQSFAAPGRRRERLDLSGTQVVVAGDWHGSRTAGRDVIERAATGGSRVVLHIGDLNVPALGAPSITKALDRACARTGVVLLVSPGNHDNWDRIDAAPLDDAGMHVLGRNVRALPRGARFEIAGRRFGALGGAVSVLGRLIRGETWWPQEAITDEHVRLLGTAPLDVLLTHDAPAGVPLSSGYDPPADLVAEADELRARLLRAVQITRPRLVFCGHWHTRRIYDQRVDDETTTTVHVLNREHTVGNAILLDLTTLDVAPLPAAAGGSNDLHAPHQLG
ncbi:metallophosphoesterase family protein [Cellulomonas sp.]|uniref:metallophosphoesterase family protein n=1 Tax=Cellulomonas sp. TaxID=40001 RepID=UPI003BAA5455